MIIAKSKNIALNKEDDRSMKIFEKAKFRNREENIKDFILDSDDTNMKIFSKSGWISEVERSSATWM